MRSVNLLGNIGLVGILASSFIKLFYSLFTPINYVTIFIIIKSIALRIYHMS